MTEEIGEEIWKQFEAIRRSGKTNMLDKGSVQRIALDNDFNELVDLISEGRYPEILQNYSDDKFKGLKIPECY